MQSNRSSLTERGARWLLYINTTIELLLAGFLYLCAIDSKTIYLSYGLIVLSAIVLVLTVKKFIKLFLLLREIGRVVREHVLLSNNQSHKENE